MPLDVSKNLARLQRFWDFLRLLGSQFSAHQGAQNAASLTYTTLLSLVPLMAVSLAVVNVLRPGVGTVNEETIAKIEGESDDSKEKV